MSPFCRWGSWGLGWWRGLLKFTQLVELEQRFEPRLGWLHGSSYALPPCWLCHTCKHRFRCLGSWTGDFSITTPTLGVLLSSVSERVCMMIIKHTFESSNLSFWALFCWVLSPCFPFVCLIFVTVDMSCLTGLWPKEHCNFNPQGCSLMAILSLMF